MFRLQEKITELEMQLAKKELENSTLKQDLLLRNSEQMLLKQKMGKYWIYFSPIDLNETKQIREFIDFSKTYCTAPVIGTILYLSGFGI